MRTSLQASAKDGSLELAFDSTFSYVGTDWTVIVRTFEEKVPAHIG